MDQIASDSMVTKSVQGLYERFPYPHYNLFLPLRWQEAVMATSRFARLVANQQGQAIEALPKSSPFSVLLAGCGDTQPYIMRRTENSSHFLTCVDISQNSIRRAKLRTIFFRHNMKFHHSELNQFLSSSSEKFDHIDCFGVLHHLNNPSATLRLLSSRMSTSATMRIMVYNSMSRGFIHDLQKAFRLLGLNYKDSRHLKIAKEIIKSMVEFGGDHLYKLPSILASSTNDAILVDTLFHPREAVIEPVDWFRFLDDAGLVAYSLFDRYQELDAMPNPLYTMPSPLELQKLCEDNVFQGNLEIYVRKKSTSPLYMPNLSTLAKLRGLVAGPPRYWRKFDEIRSLSLKDLYRCWFDFLEGKSENFNNLGRLKNEAPIALQRLARLGGVLSRDTRFHQRLISEVQELPPLVKPAFVEFNAYLLPIIYSQLSNLRSPALQGRVEQAMKRFYLAFTKG